MTGSRGCKANDSIYASPHIGAWRNRSAAADTGLASNKALNLSRYPASFVL
jgi:hypothetical protein